MRRAERVDPHFGWLMLPTGGHRGFSALGTHQIPSLRVWCAHNAAPDTHPWTTGRVSASCA